MSWQARFYSDRSTPRAPHERLVFTNTGVGVAVAALGADRAERCIHMGLSRYDLGSPLGGLLQKLGSQLGCELDFPRSSAPLNLPCCTPYKESARCNVRDGASGQDGRQVHLLPQQ